MSSATLNGGSCRCEPEKGPWRSNCHDLGSGGREGSVAQGDGFFGGESRPTPKQSCECAHGNATHSMNLLSRPMTFLFTC